MRLLSVTFCLTLATVAAADPPATAPATHPADVRAGVLDHFRARVRAAKIVGKYKAADLISVSAKGGELTVGWVGPEFKQGAAVQIEGSSAIWQISHAQDVKAGGNNYVEFTLYDLDRPADDTGPVMVSVTLRPGSIDILSFFAPGSPVTTVQYNQGLAGVKLHAMATENNRHRPVANAEAASFTELQRTSSAQVHKYLLPVLRRLDDTLFMGPGAADVYRVFDQIKADPKVAQKVNELLAAMDSPDPAQRDEASKQMAALGRPGVLAALRVDPDTLTAEQKGRLNTMLATHSHRQIADPSAARRDPEFLLDALEDEDLAVRQAARTALAAATNRNTDLDVSTRDVKLSTAVEALRAALAPKPATEPAE